jgi:hypothetical protein
MIVLLYAVIPPMAPWGQRAGMISSRGGSRSGSWSMSWSDSLALTASRSFSRSLSRNRSRGMSESKKARRGQSWSRSRSGTY